MNATPPTIISPPRLAVVPVAQRASPLARRPSLTQIPRWQSTTRWIARILVVGAFIYTAWYYGGTEPKSLYAASIALLCAAILEIVSSRRVPTDLAMPRAMMFCGLLWIVYAVVQMLPIAPGFAWYFPGISHGWEQYARKPIAELSELIHTLGSREVIDTNPRGTVALDETREALPPFLLAFSFAYLTWRLFSTSQSRKLLLWSLVIHCTLIAGWGILQRAAGSVEMLPGIPDRFPGTQFSSFIYKNAGAAAIMPGAAVAILLMSLQPRRQSTAMGYRSQTRFGHPRQLVLLLCIVIIGIGLLAALSRGAWIAALVSGLAAILLSRYPLRRQSFGWKTALAIASAIAIGAVATTYVAERISSSVQQRVDDLALERIASDSRWDQWIDGCRTAWAHFPSGSGLGTYGYAVLPIQTHTRPGWFREAHNQYLEIATESGLIGLTLLVIFLGVFVFNCASVIRSAHHDRLKLWARFGVAIFLLAAIQSVVDFVIVIPANLFLYACLSSIVAAKCEPAVTRKKVTSDSWLYKASSSPLGWSALVVLMLLGSLKLSSNEIQEREVIEETSITTFERNEPSERIEEAIALLDDAILDNPSSSSLHERRAAWMTMRYRSDLVAEAERRGERVPWQTTDLINVLSFVQNSPEKFRHEIASDFVSTADMRDDLTEILSDYLCVLATNPYRPTVHTEASILLPILEVDALAWLDRAAQLSQNDSRRLFRNGLAAHALNDEHRMIDQWSDSLTVNLAFIDPIVSVAKTRISRSRVAQELFPPEQPDLLVWLARQEMPADPVFVQSLIEMCEQSSQAKPQDRESAIAQLYQLIAEYDQAVVHWGNALQLDPKNAEYRWHYANSLLYAGKPELALDQAVLGKALFPRQNRFQQLVDFSRKAMARSR